MFVTGVRVGVLMVLMSGRVAAQPSSPPTAYELFRGSIEYAALDCDTEARTARVRLEFDAGKRRRAAAAAWARCASAAKSAAHKTLQPALLAFAQDPKALGLLKAYHARWLAHLDTTGLELSRSDLARSLRIEESGVAAEQARITFEKEAGLN